jgi:hypothetical protein
MSYTGFLTSPDYTRRSQNETIDGEWVFSNVTTFEKVVRGTALATYYGDIAEYYEHDNEEMLPVGTLVKFGGKYEITKTQKDDKSFFGIISSNPGVVLNEQESDRFSPIALCGRVPCRVNGFVKKFDKLTISKVPGVARKKTFLDTLLRRPTIGIALEDKFNKFERLIPIFVRANI